jgi:hypothetical protein
MAGAGVEAATGNALKVSSCLSAGQAKPGSEPRRGIYDRFQTEGPPRYQVPLIALPLTNIIREAQRKKRSIVSISPYTETTAFSSKLTVLFLIYFSCIIHNRCV